MTLPILKREQLRQFLTDDDTYATVLLTVAVDHYGTEVFTWHPGTIIQELEEDCNVELPQLNIDKLNAAISLLVSNDFYRRLPVFINVCNVLSGSDAQPDVVDPADARECAWGMTEAMLIQPPDDDEPFTNEIRYYLGKVLDAEGIRTPPDLLRIALFDTASSKADYSLLSSQDPAMFNAEFDMQRDNAGDIENMVRQNLQELFEQLDKVPLQHGNTQELVKRIQGNLQAA